MATRNHCSQRLSTTVGLYHKPPYDATGRLPVSALKDIAASQSLALVSAAVSHDLSVVIATDDTQMSMKS